MLHCCVVLNVPHCDDKSCPHSNVNSQLDVIKIELFQNDISRFTFD